MKILPGKLCAIFVAALYISPVCATSFQLDFSLKWHVPQSILQLGIGEAETLIFSSLVDTEDEKEHSAASPSADFIAGNKNNIYTIPTGHTGLSDLADGLPATAYISEMISLSGFRAIKDDLRPDVASAVIRLIDEQGFDFDTGVQPAADFVMVMAGSSEYAVRPASSFSFLSVQHLRSQNIPDPAPVWLVGLMLGITGVAWRLLNVST